MTKYEINGWFKFAEQDHWEEGCDPDTGFSFSGDDRYRSATIEDLLKQIRDFVGVPDDYEIELDSCDEDGRVDIQVLETADGYPANDRDIEKWKKGDLALWYATYSFMIERVTREPVRLTETNND